MTISERKLVVALGNLTSLPVLCIDKRTIHHDIVLLGSLNESLSFILNKPYINKLVKENEDIPTYRFENRERLSFLALNFPQSTETIVFGPFFLNQKNPDFLISSCEHNIKSKLSEQSKTRILESIPTKTDLFLSSWTTIVSQLSGLLFTEVPAFREPEGETVNENSLSIVQLEENRVIEHKISSGYEFQALIQKALLKGDKESLNELLLPKDRKSLENIQETYAYNIKDRGKSNRLKYGKSMMSILNTIFRLTAENAGLPPIYLHSISNNIARAIESSTQIEDIRLIKQMINAYCDAINSLNIKNNSFRIIRVKKYIITNLTKDFSLEDLATVANISPQHLSRLFRKECGITLTDYIRKQRIREAKLMIQSTDMPIFHIAESLGFSSQNYFCKVFQKETGMTPTKYKAECEKVNN